VGRQWIFEYTLAISKEMLGYVRGKYSNIPIPNAEVTLNQSDLITAATAEKTALIERLRTYFDETSRKSLLERRAQETEFKQAELKQVPYTIYIG
jgi:aspartate ammonia-lyase